MLSRVRPLDVFRECKIKKESVYNVHFRDGDEERMIRGKIKGYKSSLFKKKKYLVMEDLVEVTPTQEIFIKSMKVPMESITYFSGILRVDRLTRASNYSRTTSPPFHFLNSSE